MKLKWGKYKLSNYCWAYIEKFFVTEDLPSELERERIDILLKYIFSFLHYYSYLIFNTVDKAWDKKASRG